MLQGNLQLIELLKDANWLGVSVISQIKFLVFTGLSQNDSQIFEQFLQRVEVLGLVAIDAVRIVSISSRVHALECSTQEIKADWNLL
nr:hypothetical protein [Argonema galeatum]